VYNKNTIKDYSGKKQNVQAEYEEALKLFNQKG
jgi:hypothetical protein